MTEAAPARQHWSELSDEELLNLRFCELGLRIEGTQLEGCVQQLYGELDARGLKLRPPCYLGDEWFSPSGVPAIAIPFYLAHPRLAQLERKMMMEVEGGAGHADTMRFLRHEAGHAVCHAFLLTEHREWKSVFGSSSAREFRDHYRFQPYSRNFVRHLENWYAQSHPDEDFAETFSVWLTPGLDWKALYSGWPALRKVEFVDRLMADLAGKPPVVSKGRKTYDVRRLQSRLRTHYEHRRRLYAEESPSFFDRDLTRIFADRAALPGTPASRFLRRHRGLIVGTVAFWTRERKFTVDRLLKQLITRCDELKLGVPRDEDRAKVETTAYLSALASNYRFTGRLKRGP
ncbi:MAG TPA: hypothetical protein VMR29_09360 [Candidatus Binatia bacterium]|nr:hypothetical protein [Candidatus Binatia bacterium]